MAQLPAIVPRQGYQNKPTGWVRRAQVGLGQLGVCTPPIWPFRKMTAIVQGLQS